MRVKKGKKTIPHTTDRLTQPDPTRSLPERISHTDRDWKEVNIVRACVHCTENGLQKGRTNAPRSGVYTYLIPVTLEPDRDQQPPPVPSIPRETKLVVVDPGVAWFCCSSYE